MKARKKKMVRSWWRSHRYCGSTDSAMRSMTRWLRTYRNRK